MKNTLEGVNNRLRVAVEQVSNQKDKVIEIIQSTQQRKKDNI